jgi:2-keto-4-pentenoate hydratase
MYVTVGNRFVFCKTVTAGAVTAVDVVCCVATFVLVIEVVDERRPPHSFVATW